MHALDQRSTVQASELESWPVLVLVAPATPQASRVGRPPSPSAPPSFSSCPSLHLENDRPNESTRPSRPANSPSTARENCMHGRVCVHERGRARTNEGRAGLTLAIDWGQRRLCSGPRPSSPQGGRGATRARDGLRRRRTSARGVSGLEGGRRVRRGEKRGSTWLGRLGVWGHTAEAKWGMGQTTRPGTCELIHSGTTKVNHPSSVR